jgi:hypothetical protein
MMCVFEKGGIDGKGKAACIGGVVKGRCENLRAYAKSRLSGTETAKKLKRTPGAVAQKAMTLGIRFRSIRRKAG